MVLLKLDSSTIADEGEDFRINFNNFELKKGKPYEVALIKAHLWYFFRI